MNQREFAKIVATIKKYEAVLRKHPEQSDALFMLGNCYRQISDLQAAAEQYRNLLAIAPDHPKANAAMGQTLRLLRRSSDAVPYFEKAISLSPTDSDLICDLGDALQDLRQWDNSATCYQSAVKSSPKLTRAWYAWGCAELGRREFVAAIPCFQKALEQSPDWLEARHNLARALYEVGQTTAAAVEFRSCASKTDHPNSILSHTMLATIIPGDPAAGNRSILDTRRDWARRSLPASPPNGAVASNIDHREHRPLRVGYISSFLAGHNWMKPVWGLINRHPRDEFEIHLFSDDPISKIRYGYKPDPQDRFHDISSSSNQAVATLIKESGIDILVDLNSYSVPRRLPLFALRPAPRIIAWFNLYATSGIPTLDYIIGDRHVVLEAEEQFYSEKVLRVSGSYSTFDPLLDDTPDVSAPPSLKTGKITFGSMASQYKITPEVVDVWSRILTGCPTSSLLIKNRALDSLGLREYLAKRFEDRGVALERLHFEGSAEHFTFLGAYGKVDIALDTFPYNGGTTTIEAVWQGVPMLTFFGDRWVSRTSASILRSGGLSEWVKNSVDEYVARAIDLAGSPDTPQRLAALRQNLRSQLLASEVCDTRTFAKEMEQIYRQVFSS